MIFDQDLTDAQIRALYADSHIVTSDPDATEVKVVHAWVMLKGRRYVATVYDQSVALDMFGDGRADSMQLVRVFRHPQTGAAGELSATWQTETEQRGKPHGTTTELRRD